MFLLYERKGFSNFSSWSVTICECIHHIFKNYLSILQNTRWKNSYPLIISAYLYKGQLASSSSNYIFCLYIVVFLHKYEPNSFCQAYKLSVLKFMGMKNVSEIFQQHSGKDTALPKAPP